MNRYRATNITMWSGIAMLVAIIIPIALIQAWLSDLQTLPDPIPPYIQILAAIAALDAITGAVAIITAVVLKFTQRHKPQPIDINIDTLPRPPHRRLKRREKTPKPTLLKYPPKSPITHADTA